MLVGREVETECIDHLLDEARGGRSGTLVLNGEPGIGKSSLCAYAVERATGMTVLKARGAEWETELPFAALADLLHPVLGCIDEIPHRRRLR